MRRLVASAALLAGLGALLAWLLAPPAAPPAPSAPLRAERAEAEVAPPRLHGAPPAPERSPRPEPPPAETEPEAAADAAPPAPGEDPDAPVAPGAIVDLVRADAPDPLRIPRDDLLGRVLPYGMRATREARDVQWTGVARIDVSFQDPVDLERPTTAITGLVAREDLQPLAGAELILYSTFYLRRARYDHRVVEIGRVTTGADGRFDLRPVALDTVHFGADGEILVTIRHPRVADLVAQPLPHVRPGRVSDVGTLVLPDASASIRGVVRDLAGAPVVGAVVRVSGAMDPVRYDKTDRMVVLKDCPQAVTDAEGRYVLDDFAPGIHDASIHVNIDCVLHQARRWQGETEWSPRVRAGNQVRGRVVDPDGEPVEAAVVAGGGNWTPSNADGTFWLDNVDPGPLTLEVSHHAWRHVTLPGVATNGDDVVIRMAAPLARIELDLTDAAGAPVPLIQVAWQWAPGTGPTAFTPASPYWSDPGGHYELIVPENAVGAEIGDRAGRTLALDAEALRDGTRTAQSFPE